MSKQLRNLTITIYRGEDISATETFETDYDVNDWAASDVALAWAPFKEEELVTVLDVDGSVVPKVDVRNRGETTTFSGNGIDSNNGAVVPWRIVFSEA